MLLLIPAVIKKVLKFAFKFVDIDNDGIIGQLFDFTQLDVCDGNARKKQVNEKGGYAAYLGRQKPAKMVVGMLEKSIHTHFKVAGCVFPQVYYLLNHCYAVANDY